MKSSLWHTRCAKACFIRPLALFFSGFLLWTGMICAQEPAPTPYPHPDWLPGSGGALPAPPVFQSNPGEVGLLFVGRSHRRYKSFIFGNEHPTEAEVELNFARPEEIGATHYTMEISEDGHNFLTVEQNGEPVILDWYSYHARPWSSAYYRLRIHSGPHHGKISNTVYVPFPSLETMFSGWSFDEGMWISGVMTPFVGCGKNFEVSVTKLMDDTPEDLQPFLSYQWFRVNPLTYEQLPIEGANDPTYITQNGDAGYLLMARVSGDGTNVGGFVQFLSKPGPIHAVPAFVSDVVGNSFRLHLFRAPPAEDPLTAEGLRLTYWNDEENKEVEIGLSSVTHLGGQSYQITTDTNLTALPAGQVFTLENSSSFWVLAMEMGPEGYHHMIPVVNFNNIPSRQTAWTLPASGGSFFIPFNSTQPWRVVEALSWLVANPAQGSGSGTITITVQPNSGALPRSGTVKIGDQTYTVSQLGFIQVDPTGQSIPKAGENYTVQVTSSKPWKVSGVPKWLQVSPLAGGAGTTAVQISVEANSTPLVRAANLSFSGLPHAISQEPGDRTVVGNASMVTIPVAATAPWTVDIDPTDSWISANPTSGVGRATVRLSLAENPTSLPRTATVIINGMAHTIHQAGQTPANLHRGTYSGLLYDNEGNIPTAPEGGGSILDRLSEDGVFPEGGIQVTVTAGAQGLISYTGSIRRGGVVYTGRGTVDGSGSPWSIVGEWSSGGRTPRTVLVDLEFIVNAPTAKLLRGSVSSPTGDFAPLAALAGKQIFNGKDSVFPRTGPLVGSIGGDWPAVVSLLLQANGTARIMGKFVDGTPLTMNAPVSGATGVEGEWAILFSTGIYGQKGNLHLYTREIPNSSYLTCKSLAELPGRPELPPSPGDNLAYDAGWTEFAPYTPPARGQSMLAPGSSDGTATAFLAGSLDADPSTAANPWVETRFTHATNKMTALGANENKMKFTTFPATGLFEGSFSLPVTHPEDATRSLGSRTVKIFGFVSQFPDNPSHSYLWSCFLSPTVRAKSLNSGTVETIGATRIFELNQYIP